MAKRKVLLVDHEARSVERVSAILTQAGYDVEVAQDVVAGLVAFEQTNPDLVLIQMVLPEKPGFELCREIRASRPAEDLPILILGSSNAGKARAQAAAAGADGYLCGQLTPATLARVCAECLAGRPVSRSEPVEETAPDTSASEIQTRLEEILPEPRPREPVELPRPRPKATFGRSTAIPASAWAAVVNAPSRPEPPRRLLPWTATLVVAAALGSVVGMVVLGRPADEKPAPPPRPVHSSVARTVRTAPVAHPVPIVAPAVESVPETPPQPPTPKRPPRSSAPRVEPRVERALPAPPAPPVTDESAPFAAEPEPEPASEPEPPEPVPEPEVAAPPEQSIEAPPPSEVPPEPPRAQ